MASCDGKHRRSPASRMTSGHWRCLLCGASGMNSRLGFEAHYRKEHYEAGRP